MAMLRRGRQSIVFDRHPRHPLHRRHRRQKKSWKALCTPTLTSYPGTRAFRQRTWEKAESKNAGAGTGDGQEQGRNPG